MDRSPNGLFRCDADGVRAAIQVVDVSKGEGIHRLLEIQGSRGKR